MTTYTWERTRPWLRYPMFLQLQPIQLSHNRCEMYMGVLTQSKKCLDSVCIEINNAHITDTGCGLVWFSCGTVTIKSQCMVTGSITFTTTGLSPLYRFHTSGQNTVLVFILHHTEVTSSWISALKARQVIQINIFENHTVTHSP